MTFVEAAIEVLYRAGRPLHYKKIAEAALNEDLLSHRGRSTAETMEERLTLESKKQGDSLAIESVRPGVYKLSDSCLKRLEEEGRERLPLGKKKAVQANGRAAEEERRPVDHEGAARESSGDEDRSRRRRRRTRSADDSPEASQRSRRASSFRSRSEGRARRRRSSRSGRGERSERKSTSSRRRSTSRANGRDDRRAARSNSRQRRQTGKRTTAKRHLVEGPVQMDVIARAVHTVLGTNERKPMNVADLAKEIFERRLVKFHTHDAAATVQAAMAGDNQLRERAGNRPLFIRYGRERWGLTSWGLSQDSVDREQSILSLAEEIRQDAVQTLGEALTDVKSEALEHLALTLLQRLGYQEIKVSKRSADGDVFFTSDWRQGLADVRVCIQVVGDTELELEADAVTGLRGTLHHYSASEGVIIHLGDIDEDAIKESREERLAPITLLDRDTFVELLIKHGIGVRTYQAPITMVDTSFIDAITSA